MFPLSGNIVYYEPWSQRERGLCRLHSAKPATSQALLPLTYPASEKACVELALVHSIISELPTFLTVSEETRAPKGHRSTGGFPRLPPFSSSPPPT